MAMASNIQTPNLKTNVIVLSKIKLTTNISAITLKLMTETPNIKSTNADNSSAANSNITFLKYKKCKAKNICFAFLYYYNLELMVSRVRLFHHVQCHILQSERLQQSHYNR